MMNDSDKLLLLRIIKTGDYSRILSFRTNLDSIKLSNSSYSLKQNPNSYKMASSIANILYPSENQKIKKNLGNLIAFELNHYKNTREREKVYEQLKALSSNLSAFPVQKRLNKFLTTFVKASKELQNIVVKENNLDFLKTLKILTFEVKKNADLE